VNEEVKGDLGSVVAEQDIDFEIIESHDAQLSGSFNEGDLKNKPQRTLSDAQPELTESLDSCTFIKELPVPLRTQEIGK
jgi:hypothetical protein